MDITSTAAATTTASVKTPEAETETPPRIQPTKPLSLTNGVLKRNHPLLHRHQPNAPPVVVTYKECLKNHAASLGAHAVDGCGEFMPSPSAILSDPTSLKCAACGCHRNFHRRDPEEPFPHITTSAAQYVIEYQPHHRHHPPPPLQQPRGGNSSPNSASPPPISSSYYPSAPHMLLALSAGLSGHPPENNPLITMPASTAAAVAANPNSRKRFRTKFSQDQKDRMLEFAERVDWKIQKRDEDLIMEFCSEVGVDKSVLKVWMHNNKSAYGKKDVNNNNGNIGICSIDSLDNATADHHHFHHHINNDNSSDQSPNHHHNNDSVSAHVLATNGSSSSS